MKAYQSGLVKALLLLSALVGVIFLPNQQERFSQKQAKLNQTASNNDGTGEWSLAIEGKDLYEELYRPNLQAHFDPQPKQEQQPMNSIEKVRLAILEELEPADKVAAEMETQLEKVNQHRARLRAALEELDKELLPKKLKSKERSKAATPKKPTAKQADVKEVALALVQENPGIEKKDLEALTKQKLKEDLGFDLKGFANRWKEVMGSNVFTIDELGSVKLMKPSAKLPEHTAVGNAQLSSQLPVENRSADSQAG